MRLPNTEKAARASALGLVPPLRLHNLHLRVDPLSNEGEAHHDGQSNWKNDPRLKDKRMLEVICKNQSEPVISERLR